MDISENVEIIGLSLYFKDLKVLVLGDVHLGYEEDLNKQGVLIPRHHLKDVTKNANDVFNRLKTKENKLKTIVINGDLKHEFGRISNQEWRDVLRFLDLLSENCERIVLVKGNHDIFLGPIAKKRNVKLADNYFEAGVFICHGHQIPSTTEYKNSELVVIGNEHPAISIKDGVRTETFKCFLKGKFRGKNMIVMPSFNPITIGTDVLKEKFISPFLKTDVSDFEVFVVADKEYYFGKVKHNAKL